MLVITLGYPVFAFLPIGSMIMALSHDGVFGIDEPSRRSMVYRTVWVFIALAYVMTTATLGVLASRYLPIGVTVFLVAAAALLFQPVQRHLERLADRWVFGARLNGYDVLTGFGTMLNSA